MAAAKTSNMQIVVPATYDPAEGWALIWRLPEERTYFYALSDRYDKVTLDRLGTRYCQSLTLPARVCKEHTPISINEISSITWRQRIFTRHLVLLSVVAP